MRTARVLVVPGTRLKCEEQVAAVYRPGDKCLGMLGTTRLLNYGHILSRVKRVLINVTFQGFGGRIETTGPATNFDYSVAHFRACRRFGFTPRDAPTFHHPMSVCPPARTCLTGCVHQSFECNYDHCTDINNACFGVVLQLFSARGSALQGQSITGEKLFCYSNKIRDNKYIFCCGNQTFSCSNQTFC